MARITMFPSAPAYIMNSGIAGIEEADAVAADRHQSAP